jgi:hypothetical protein
MNTAGEEPIDAVGAAATGKFICGHPDCLKTEEF